MKERIQYSASYLIVAIGLVLLFILVIGIAPFRSTGYAVNTNTDSYITRYVFPDVVGRWGLVTVNLEVNVDNHPNTEDFYFIDEIIPTGFTINNSGSGNTSHLGHIKWLYIAGYNGTVGNATNTNYSYTLNAPSPGATIDYPLGGTFGFTSTLGSGIEDIIGDTNVQVFVDTAPPNITRITPIGLTYKANRIITIGANVVDNVFVDTVTLRVRLLNSTDVYPALTPSGSFYSAQYITPQLSGQYNITMTATDNSSNSANEASYFVVDANSPQITGNSSDVSVMFNNNATLWVNATDNFNVTSAQITIGGFSDFMNYAGGNRWEYIYIPNSSVIGPHQYMMAVYDDVGNNASTIFYTITVTDNGPSLSEPIPNPATTFNISDKIEIGITATDDIGIANVSAIVNSKGVNSSAISLIKFGNKYNTSFDAVEPGAYNVYFEAKDTSGNTAYASTSFIVNSPTPIGNLSISNVYPTNGATFYLGDNLLLSAIVTDNMTITDVHATIVLEGRTPENVNLIANGNNYSGIYLITSVGNYNLTFVATNNLSESKTSFVQFTANPVPPRCGDKVCDPGEDSLNCPVDCPDTTPPQIIGSSQDISVMFNNNALLWINATDSVGVTYAQVTINSSPYAMNYVGGNRWEYMYNPTNSDVGVHPYRMTVNDAAGYFVSTPFYAITVTDNGPTLSNPIPRAPQNQFLTLDKIEIGITATDDIDSILTVSAVIQDPTGANQTLILDNVPGTDKYNNSFSIPAVTGTYYVYFTAKDSNNNNAYSSTNFIANPPQLIGNLSISNVLPVNGSIFNPGNNISLSAVVTDNLALINEVYVTIASIGFSAYRDLTANGNNYSTTFTIPGIGNYNLTFVATNNLGESKTSFAYFTVVPWVGCGDALCINGETCATCPGDCGDCPPNGGGGNNGGGGGGGNRYSCSGTSCVVTANGAYTTSNCNNQCSAAGQNETRYEQEFEFDGTIYRTQLISTSLGNLQVGIVAFDGSEIASDEILYYEGYTLQGTGQIVSGVIYFKVSLDWIKTNNIIPEEIVLYSYKDFSWSPRPTQKIAEDEGYMYFSSQIESFDSVAITGKTIGGSSRTDLLGTTWFWVLIGLLAGMIVIVVLVIIIRQYKKNQLNKLTSI